MSDAALVAQPLTCSECGTTGTYRMGVQADVTCRECGNEVNYIDFIMNLSDGESLQFIDGVLHVMIPVD